MKGGDEVDDEGYDEDDDEGGKVGGGEFVG